MNLICKVKGHNWMGLKCIRCGEVKGAKEQEREIAHVRAITDEKELIMVALETNYLSVCREAAKRINDPGALAELALKFFDKEVISRITDQEMLKKIFFAAPDEHSADAALANIEDEAFLIKEIIENKHLDKLPCRQGTKGSVPFIRKTAISKIKDQEYLYKLASWDVFERHRIDLSHLFEADQECAVHGINDEDKLFALAKGIRIPHQIAAAAISRMNNKENLQWLEKNLFKGNTYPTVGQMAGMRLRGEVFYTPKFR